jgi:hypothetical protein
VARAHVPRQDLRRSLKLSDLNPLKYYFKNGRLIWRHPVLLWTCCTVFLVQFAMRGFFAVCLYTYLNIWLARIFIDTVCP